MFELNLVSKNQKSDKISVCILTMDIFYMKLTADHANLFFYCYRETVTKVNI